jgi:hypothetical protein
VGCKRTLLHAAHHHHVVLPLVELGVVEEQRGEFVVVRKRLGGCAPLRRLVPARSSSTRLCRTAMQKLRIVTLGFRVGDRSRGRYATPADFPGRDGTPYRGLRVRHWGLGFVHRSRTILCRPVPYPNPNHNPNPTITIRDFVVAVCRTHPRSAFSLHNNTTQSHLRLLGAAGRKQTRARYRVKPLYAG